MLLRIIDNTNNHNKDTNIKIVLDDQKIINSFVTEPYIPVMTDNFQKSQAWYNKEYLQQESNYMGDADMAEKLIKFGQYIGDKLLGENLELMQLHDYIELHGYDKLEVQIESSRVDFFNEMWETAIFHESKYVLSTIVKGFVRQFVGNEFTDYYPELRYDLGNNIQDSNLEIEKKPNPLRILYLISRPKEIVLPYASCNSINLCLDSVEDRNVIDYEIFKLTDWEKLKNRLQDKTKPVHIVHFDGPVVIRNNVANITLGDSMNELTFLDIHEFCSFLVESKVALLSIDARDYQENNQSIPALTGLASIAKSAHQCGLGNVLGLGQITNPWVSGECFDIVYYHIIKGLNLNQAIVEARKKLQSKNESTLMTLKPIDFHAWPLLTHYSNQRVIFFESNQALNNSSSHEIQPYQDKLYGFRSEMLPPLLNQVGDGQVLELIDQLSTSGEFTSNMAVAITGESGSGKTQLAHVANLLLSQKLQIDYGFYFDYSNIFYSMNDMLEMIAPILDYGINQRSQVKERLMKLHCCFVLDGVKNNRQNQVLNQFLQTLLSNGHIIIVIGDSNTSLHELMNIKIRMAPLLPIEQQILAINSLRKIDTTENSSQTHSNNRELQSLLASINGHPWLTKKLMLLSKTYGINELKAQVELHINSQGEGSKIERFYNWQWKQLGLVWRRLLILCGEIPGLLLEMLMIVFDHKDPFMPAKEIMKLLGGSDATFSEGLNLWEKSGFLNRLPNGRIIDPRCLEFLEANREQSFSENHDKKKLQLYFSQLICEGIRMLTQHILKQPNQTISNNLLFNRRKWVEHFENLWFNAEYSGFIDVKNAFDQLLQQANLSDESKAWSLDLLKRSPEIVFEDEHDEIYKLTWLRLATNALDREDAKEVNCILEGVQNCRIWFDRVTETIDHNDLMLFQLVVIFLEKYYNGISNWNECISICEKSYNIFIRYKIWHGEIQALKSLAKYYSELGNNDKALIFENRLIEDVDYENAPVGFHTQLMLDILFARVSRTDTIQAQALLNIIKETDQATQLEEILNGVQCDIYYQQKNYIAALPHYCKIWAHALKTNHQAQIERLKPRLKELEKKLGLKEFEELFEREVPKGTIKPKDYVSFLH